MTPRFYAPHRLPNKHARSIHRNRRFFYRSQSGIGFTPGMTPRQRFIHLVSARCWRIDERLAELFRRSAGRLFPYSPWLWPGMRYSAIGTNV